LLYCLRIDHYAHCFDPERILVEQPSSIWQAVKALTQGYHRQNGCYIVVAVSAATIS